MEAHIAYSEFWGLAVIMIVIVSLRHCRRGRCQQGSRDQH